MVGFLSVVQIKEVCKLGSFLPFVGQLQQVFCAHFTVCLLCNQCRQSFIFIQNDLVFIFLMSMAESFQLLLGLLISFLEGSREVWDSYFSYDNGCKQEMLEYTDKPKVVLRFNVQRTRKEVFEPFGNHKQYQRVRYRHETNNELHEQKPCSK